MRRPDDAETIKRSLDKAKKDTATLTDKEASELVKDAETKLAGRLMPNKGADPCPACNKELRFMYSLLFPYLEVMEAIHTGEGIPASHAHAQVQVCMGCWTVLLGPMRD